MGSLSGATRTLFGVRFAAVSPADPATAALVEQYFAERSAGFPVVGGYHAALPDPALFEPPAGVFLRLDDDHGAPIGCGGVRRIDPDGIGERLEVKHLYLIPPARGAGLGGALLDELERRAIELGARTVVLDTNSALTAAGGLYRSRGYEHVAPYNDNPNATDWYAKRV